MNSTNANSEPAAKPTRAAVIGCGPVGLLHAETLLACPTVRLVGLCEIDSERRIDAGRFGATFDDAATMIREATPDWVTVATPNDQHVEPCTAAFSAGCHVFCEKPLAHSYTAAKQLADLANRRRLQLAVNYNRRFGFGYATANHWLNEGRIGPLRQLFFQVSDKQPRPNIAKNRFAMLTAVLIHHIDLARWYAGEVESVACIARCPDTWPLDDLSVSLRHEGGVLTTICGAYRNGQTRTRERAVLGGESGEIEIDDVTRGATWRGLDPDATTTKKPPLFESGDAFNHSLRSHLLDFAQRLQAGRAAAVTAADGLAGLRVVDAAEQSLQSGGARVSVAS